MNIHASPGVAVDGRFALTVAHVFAIGVAMLVADLAAAVIGVVLLVIGVKTRPRAPSGSPVAAPR
jgi:hypothetical protein